MRKSILLLAFSFVLLLVGCAPNYMVAKEHCVDIRGVVPSPGKSALVVGRTTTFGSGVNVDNYLDKNFIGTTKGRSFFVTSVEPGRHYITSQAENLDTVLLNFEPGKTYYLLNSIRMGVLFARSKYYLMDAQQFYNDMDGTCNFYEIDKTGPGSDLSDERYKQVVDDYKKEHGDIPVNQTVSYQVPAKTVVKEKE